MDQEPLQQQISHQEVPSQLPSQLVVEQKEEYSEIARKKLSEQGERWKCTFDALENETGTAAAVKTEPDTNDEVQRFLNPTNKKEKDITKSCQKKSGQTEQEEVSGIYEQW